MRPADHDRLFRILLLGALIKMADVGSGQLHSEQPGNAAGSEVAVTGWHYGPPQSCLDGIRRGSAIRCDGESAQR